MDRELDTSPDIECLARRMSEGTPFGGSWVSGFHDPRRKVRTTATCVGHQGECSDA